MARAASVLGVLIVLLAGAAAARAEPLVATVSGGVVTDGASLAAWQEDDGRIVVLADALPAANPQSVELADPCPLQAVSGRLVGLLCSDGPPRLYDVLTHEEREAEGLRAARRAIGTGDDVALTGLGDRWLRLASPDATVLVDWTRGRVVEDPRLGRRAVRDLDAKRARRRLCRPLRIDHPRDTDRARLDVAYRPPYLVTRARGDLRLQRCGTSATRRLTRDEDAPFALSRRFVAWATDAKVHVRDLSSGEELVWRTPRGDHVAQLQATDRRVFATIEPPVGAPETYVLEPARP